MKKTIVSLSLVLTGCTISFGTNGISILPTGPNPSNVSSTCISNCVRQLSGNASYVSPDNHYGECASICEGIR